MCDTEREDDVIRGTKARKKEHRPGGRCICSLVMLRRMKSEATAEPGDSGQLGLKKCSICSVFKKGLSFVGTFQLRAYINARDRNVARGRASLRGFLGDPFKFGAQSRNEGV